MNKSWMPKVLALAVAMQFPLAYGEYEELPTLTVEGELMEPGTTALRPGTVSSLDAADLLKYVPGANVHRNGPLTGIAYFRGLYNEPVNVLTDGMSLKNAGPNSMDSRMSYIPVTMVRSIKTWRDVTPVSSGLETMGGSIITESRKVDFTDSSQFEFHGFGAAGYSWVNDGRYGAVLAGVANQHYRVHFSGTTERGDDYRYKGDTVLDPTEYARDTYQVGLGIKRSGHEFGITYDNKHTGFSGTPSLPMDIRYVDADVVHGDYGWDMGSIGKVKFKGWYQSSRHVMTNYHLRQPPADPKKFRYMKTEVEAGGYKFAWTLPEIANGELEIGFDGDIASHDAVVKNPNNKAFFVEAFNDVRRNRYGAYVGWRGEPIKKLQLLAGVRYRHTYMDAGRVDSLPARNLKGPGILRDRFNGSNRKQRQNDVDLALDLRYSFSDSLDLTLGLARKTQAPTYQQRYLWLPIEATGGLADGRVYVGNVGLDSQKAYEVVAGFDLHLDELWMLQNVYFEPRGFYRYINDYIQGVPATDKVVRNVANVLLPNGCPNGPSTGADCVLQYANIDAQIYGADAQAGFSIGDHWRVDGLLNYTRGERISGPDDNLYRIAPFNGRLKVTYSIWDFAFSTEYVGALRQNKVAKFNNERKTSDWSILNVRLQYQPSYKYVDGLKVAFGVDNIFDNEHADHLNGINRARGNKLAVGQRVRNPGRNVYATLSYEF